MSKILCLVTLSFGLAVSAFAQTGKITGKLTYPSEYVPPEMIVCVKNTGSGATFCSNERASRLSKSKIGFKLNFRGTFYEVRLPAGTYYIYATFPRGKAPTSDMEGIRAFYNEFVKCGMNVKCKSKKPIALKVAAGRTVRGITLGDWYR